MNLVVEGFSWEYFFISIFITIIPFLWLLKKSRRVKLYVLPFVVFFYVYSGLGVSWSSCDKSYLLYYFVWLVFFSITIHMTMGRKKICSMDGIFSSSGERLLRYANHIIVIYFILLLLSLAQEGKLFNLLSPQAPDLAGVMDEVSKGEGGGGLLYYAKHISHIFYMVSLYKYRYKIGKLFILMFLPFYISYAESSYVARSTIMAYLIIYCISIYYYNPSIRRKLRLLFVVGMPVLLIGLSFYTFIRMGREIDISAGDAITLLAYQETKYPTHFTAIQKLPESYKLLYDYFNWLLTLPLPGFLKDSSKDYFFNAIFTETISGVYRGQMGFSVALPGIVNEGLFIFGMNLFWLHAVIVGLFVGISYRIVTRKNEFFLFLYLSVFMASLFARAGSVSAYSIYLKSFLMYEIVTLLISSKNLTILKK